MRYVKIIDGQVAEYPYTFTKLRRENPNVSFPSEMPGELLVEYNVFPVVTVTRPARTLTQDVVEQAPQQINGVWTQVWAMVDVSPEEAARRQQDATDVAHAAAVKADAFVKNFIAMTPAQVETYVQKNTANLGQTRALLEKMALMLLTLAKREYR